MKPINDKVFIDSNVLIYAYSIDEIEKRESIESLLEGYSNIFISTQVLNEFINVMLKKKKASLEEIQKAIQEFTQLFSIATISVFTIESALSISKKYKFSYFDSLIIASALENLCTTLYTEDMHHNQTIETTLKLISPFKK